MHLHLEHRTLASRYAIEREIGRGGAAIVYLADDLRHDRKVAVKVLRPEVAASVGSTRFLREIRIAAGLSHPYLVPVHDSGEGHVVPPMPADPAAPVLYFVMPYVAGGSLRQALIDRPQLPLADAVRITGDVAEALDCVHRREFIHRDIKPENILFLERHAALTDFGIARARTREPGQTDSGSGWLLGTPEYMSPEACGGDAELDARADQYGLACVVYEMLAGQPPFTAAFPRAVIARHLGDAVPPLTTMRPDLPAAVGTVIERALAKEPGDRYPSTKAFAEALAAAAASHAAAVQRAIAVLPFTVVDGLPEDEALADGITDELISALSRLGELRVASRTSAYALKGCREDVRAIADRLHVGCVLEGTVRRAGRQMRVAVRLVSARDGCALWAERFDRDIADTLAIQDEIAGQVARALRVVFRGGRTPASRPVPTSDIRAWEYYLRGRQYARTARRQGLQFARELFQRAVALDPEFAIAWAGAASASAQRHMYYPSDSEDDLSLADEASARALALAPELPEAHAARGYALWRLGRPDEAVAELETAMRLDPHQFEARYVLARLSFQRGATRRAATLFEEAARAEEHYEARFFAAQSWEALDEKARAEAAYRRALHVVKQHQELNPDDPRAATMRAVCHSRLGEREEGIAWAAQARRLDPTDPGVLYNVACLYALEGLADQAIQCLRETIRVGFGDHSWIAHDPDLRALHDDPRFQALMRPPTADPSHGAGP